MKTIPLRKDIDSHLKWDLTPLYQNKEAVTKALEDLKNQADELQNTYKGKLNSPETIIPAIKDYMNVVITVNKLRNYASLSVDTDLSNGENVRLSSQINTVISTLLSQLSFIESEIKEVDDSILGMVQNEKECKGFIAEIIRNKPHMLSAETEKALSALDDFFQTPYKIYNYAKMVDLTYPDLEIENQKLPFGFVAFENSYDGISDTKIRRKAFSLFSEHLAKYQHTIAAALNAQMQLEKTTATLRGFNSVFDYLLFEQKVSRELYDRQIDVIVEQLAPAMRKYANLLKKIHKLDKITFADLKLAVDPSFETKLSPEESKKYIFEALKAYGEPYQKMLHRAYDEHWIDFAFNQNKTSGAYCSSPYGVHPYVLLSWSGSMEDVFTLAHELGHAGQSFYSQAEQSIFEENPTLYLIEAPSTLNELLMADYLLKQNPNDMRFKRWVLATMVGKTYYHNFVTHLLEAHFQRECYKLVDRGENLTADLYNQLKLASLKTFWGDDVELSPGAELTWMRQPHYYIGLYSYTYSAGLTISTAVHQQRLNEGDKAIQNWIEVLKKGGSIPPVEFAKMAGVDLSSDRALKTTIQFISSMIDEIEKITNQLGNK